MPTVSLASLIQTLEGFLWQLTTDVIRQVYLHTVEKLRILFPEYQEEGMSGEKIPMKGWNALTLGISASMSPAWERVLNESQVCNSPN